MITCSYCKRPAERVTGKILYPHKKELYKKIFWRCSSCDASIGCKKDSDIPLGTLANAELRQLRMQAHHALDRIWKESLASRSYLYKLMSKDLNNSEPLHIGFSNNEKCVVIKQWAKDVYIWRKLQQLHQEGFSYMKMQNVIRKLEKE